MTRDVVATVYVPLEEEVAARVRAIAEQEGWGEEEALRILLGYGAAVHLFSAPEDPLRAVGAARAELATLRHRAYMADEAVRALRMNLVGLRASVAQARRSLAYWESRRTAQAPPSDAATATETPLEEPPRPAGWVRRWLGGMRRAR